MLFRSLVKHLLEYKKYKSVVEQFHKLEAEELQKEKRGNILKEIKSLAELSNVEAELQDVDLFKLLTVFEKVLHRQEEEKNKPVHQVIQYPYTVEGQKEFIYGELSKKSRLSLTDMITYSPTRIGLIFSFLAILELLALGDLDIQVGEGFNNFWISKREKLEQTEAPVPATE